MRLLQQCHISDDAHASHFPLHSLAVKSESGSDGAQPRREREEKQEPWIKNKKKHPNVNMHTSEKKKSSVHHVEKSPRLGKLCMRTRLILACVIRH